MFRSLLLIFVILAQAVRLVGADADWIGHSRDEVIATLGKPLSALQRGNTEVLIFSNNVRVEIRANNVVAFRSDAGAVIVAGDGTRYAPSDRGKVTKVDEATAAGAGAPPPPPSPVAADEAAADVPAAPEAKAAASPTDEITETSVVPLQSVAPDQQAQLVKMTENYEQNGTVTAHEVKPPPAWLAPVKFAIAGLIRFGIALLILRIAISWCDLPCYFPDVVKVAALYVVIREGIDGVGALGGDWEFVRLFMLPDVVGFIALCLLLYGFKIVFTGITAIKVAGMTKLVTYFLMLIVGLALTIGLGFMT